MLSAIIIIIKNPIIAFSRGGLKRRNPAMTAKRLRQGVEETHNINLVGTNRGSLRWAPEMRTSPWKAKGGSNQKQYQNIVVVKIVVGSQRAKSRLSKVNGVVSSQKHHQNIVVSEISPLKDKDRRSNQKQITTIIWRFPRGAGKRKSSHDGKALAPGS